MATGKGQKGKKRPPPKRPPAAKARPKPTSTTTAPPSPPRAAPADGEGATKEKAKVTRAERLEAARRARQRKAMLTRAGVAGAVALVVLVVAVVVISNRNEAASERERLTAGSCTYDTKSDDTASTTSAAHVPPASYNVNPPAGGNHSPSAASAGVYGEGEGQTVPSDPEIVHALEHGYVVLWHKPGLTTEETAGVRKAFDAYPDDVLVVPRASLPTKAAATAWGKRLLCTDVEASTLTEFVRLYRNEGPEKVPHT